MSFLKKYILQKKYQIYYTEAVKHLFATLSALYKWAMKIVITEPVIFCSKLAIATLEHGVKYVQS